MNNFFCSDANVPLRIEHFQNVSTVMVPNSLAVNSERTVLSVNFYYLMYYKQREAVILASSAYDIVQVNAKIILHFKKFHRSCVQINFTIFRALGINDLSFGQLPTTVTVLPTASDSAGTDGKNFAY